MDDGKEIAMFVPGFILAVVGFLVLGIVGGAGGFTVEIAVGAVVHEQDRKRFDSDR